MTDPENLPELTHEEAIVTLAVDMPEVKEATPDAINEPEPSRGTEPTPPAETTIDDLTNDEVAVQIPEPVAFHFESARLMNVRADHRRGKRYTAFGQTKTLRQWADALGTYPAFLHIRLKKAREAEPSMPAETLLECVIRGVIDRIVGHALDPKTHEQWETHLGIPTGSTADGLTRWH